MTYRQTTFLLMLLPFALIGQFDGDFEFLDHRERISSKGAHVSFDDHLFYVSHNEVGPMTVISQLDQDRKLEVVFESPFSSKSKSVQTSDSTYSIFVYEIFDYDVGLPGFYAVHCTPSSYKIDTVMTFELPDVSEYYYITDVVPNSTTGYIATSYRDVLIIEDGQAARVLNDFAEFNTNLTNSSQGESLFQKGNIIWRFDGNNLDTLLEAPQSISSINYHPDGNLVLSNGNLSLYTADFSSIISQFDIDPSVSSFDELLFQDSLVYYLSSNDDQISINKTDILGNEESLIEFDEPSENIRGLVSNTGVSFLINGIYTQESITSNIFLRSVSTNQGEIYDKIFVDIDSFKLYQGIIDTLEFMVTPQGDTFFIIEYNYLADFVLANRSSEPLFAYDVFSQSFINLFGPNTFYLNYGSTDSIEIGESMRVEVPLTIPYTQTSGFNIVIPGANYKINKSPLRVAFPEFIVNVHEPVPAIGEIKVFPNPTHGLLNINSDQVLSSISIYSMDGRLAFYQSGGDFGQIDLSHLSSGSYFIIGMGRKAQRFTGKFVKI